MEIQQNQTNQIQTFQSPMGTELKVYERKGEPWFVGHEMTEALGYTNASKAVMMHVDNYDIQSTMVAHSQNGNLVRTKTNLINESGLHRHVS